MYTKIPVEKRIVSEAIRYFNLGSYYANFMNNSDNKYPIENEGYDDSYRRLSYDAIPEARKDYYYCSYANRRNYNSDIIELSWRRHPYA